MHVWHIFPGKDIDNDYLYKMLYYAFAPCTNYLKTVCNTRVAGEPDQSGSASQYKRACCDVITSQHAME